MAVNTKYLVSAFDTEETMGMPVAEVEVTANTPEEAEERAKIQLAADLESIDGLYYTVQPLE